MRHGIKVSKQAKCQFGSGSGSWKCGQQAVPLARYCIKHVMEVIIILLIHMKINFDKTCPYIKLKGFQVFAENLVYLRYEICIAIKLSTQISYILV